MIFHAVVNPAGASGHTGRAWRKLEKTAREICPGIQVHYSAPEKGIGAICREIEENAKRKEDAGIIVVGGDGSLNAAVNGVKEPGKLRFGMLPLGSGNDFGRDMGWPARPEALLRMILEGRVRHCLDIGELTYMDTGETRRFNVSCGIGFDAAICELAGRSELKNAMNAIHLGSLIYIESAFRVIGTQKSLPVRIIADGEMRCKYRHLLFLCAMNHRYEGGGFQFAPEADPSDGILNLCVAAPPHNAEFYRVFPWVPSGQHFKRFPFMHDIRGREIEVETRIPLWVHTDGEVQRECDHIRIKLMDEKLHLLD